VLVLEVLVAVPMLEIVAVTVPVLGVVVVTVAATGLPVVVELVMLIVAVVVEVVPWPLKTDVVVVVVEPPVEAGFVVTLVTDVVLLINSNIVVFVPLTLNRFDLPWNVWPDTACKVVGTSVCVAYQADLLANGLAFLSPVTFKRVVGVVVVSV
jgi:hypothetical protein